MDAGGVHDSACNPCRDIGLAGRSHLPVAKPRLRAPCHAVSEAEQVIERLLPVLRKHGTKNLHLKKLARQEEAVRVNWPVPLQERGSRTCGFNVLTTWDFTLRAFASPARRAAMEAGVEGMAGGGTARMAGLGWAPQGAKAGPVAGLGSSTRLHYDPR